uniref:Uncharacterized protein n=1 Tax=Chromera velia CCMP2878 TaxID=1169474 RepID=A0A0G4FP05_9ALVE|eukprot:Cvel_17998.t1-p1 / transcript=Cvel_17998.t1 / gene=Cvel_17998 / organism=Chromera_velia_CCMP2878 / gene_product=hypothetical protein / transcript_product=hypothetical protein / location=Cvel_scaffold1467:10554-18095(-) / protein_length=905 / sequence_SO=supercontig / SO=protein_coding / is_pseudo=false
MSTSVTFQGLYLLFCLVFLCPARGGALGGESRENDSTADLHGDSSQGSLPTSTSTDREEWKHQDAPAPFLDRNAQPGLFASIDRLWGWQGEHEEPPTGGMGPGAPWDSDDRQMHDDAQQGHSGPDGLVEDGESGPPHGNLNQSPNRTALVSKTQTQTQTQRWWGPNGWGPFALGRGPPESKQPPTPSLSPPSTSSSSSSTSYRRYSPPYPYPYPYRLNSSYPYAPLPGYPYSYPTFSYPYQQADFYSPYWSHPRIRVMGHLLSVARQAEASQAQKQRTNLQKQLTADQADAAIESDLKTLASDICPPGSDQKQLLSNVKKRLDHILVKKRRQKQTTDFEEDPGPGKIHETRADKALKAVLEALTECDPQSKSPVDLLISKAMATPRDAELMTSLYASIAFRFGKLAGDTGEAEDRQAQLEELASALVEVKHRAGSLLEEARTLVQECEKIKSLKGLRVPSGIFQRTLDSLAAFEKKIAETSGVEEDPEVQNALRWDVHALKDGVGSLSAPCESEVSALEVSESLRAIVSRGVPSDVSAAADEAQGLLRRTRVFKEALQKAAVSLTEQAAAESERAQLKEETVDKLTERIGHRAIDFCLEGLGARESSKEAVQTSYAELQTYAKTLEGLLASPGASSSSSQKTIRRELPRFRAVAHRIAAVCSEGNAAQSAETVVQIVDGKTTTSDDSLAWASDLSKLLKEVERRAGVSDQITRAETHSPSEVALGAKPGAGISGDGRPELFKKIKSEYGKEQTIEMQEEKEKFRALERRDDEELIDASNQMDGQIPRQILSCKKAGYVPPKPEKKEVLENLMTDDEFEGVITAATLAQIVISAIKQKAAEAEGRPVSPEDEDSKFDYDNLSYTLLQKIARNVGLMQKLRAIRRRKVRGRGRGRQPREDREVANST